MRYRRRGSGAIAQLLPVRIGPHDDRMETPEGVYPRLVAEHAILAGLQRDCRTPWVTTRSSSAAVRCSLSSPIRATRFLSSMRSARVGSESSPPISSHWGSPRFTEWTGYVPEQFLEAFQWRPEEGGLVRAVGFNSVSCPSVGLFRVISSDSAAGLAWRLPAPLRHRKVHWLNTRVAAGGRVPISSRCFSKSAG
jgi:Putative glutamine amidotransferase